MDLSYHCEGNPAASKGQMITGDHYRFTVLTDCMIRCEYSVSGEFVDERTQMVMNRRLDDAWFEVRESEEELQIETKLLCLIYDRKPFSQDGLRIRMKSNPYTGYAVWYYGTQGDMLPGTARTLDEADGEIPLETGVLSKNGFGCLDDTTSFRLDEEGWVMPAVEGHTDIYFLAYGREYEKCLRDYFRLTGKTPLLPRFTLGNWWSRYYKYTQEEYLELMDRFDAEKLPFSVSVIDMDWHLVDIPEKYGKGWTGYTWNRELFPDHREFLKELHRRGKAVTLNVHPADGIRAYEEPYPAAAARMGVDTEKEEQVEFNISDRKFLETYFECVHHPMEEEGVDFWWVDWQQGSRSGKAGLDPLWMLNHYHFLDSMRDGKRPLTFSRYAGLGSHRYPIGFSGDTVITWESLGFQPYFTNMASNAGYGWWSHDIGGHMNGYRDDELTTRWVQYGVFSPIMRLHSSNNEFSGKEPWKYGKEAREVMGEFLRLRHQLIPYLYTMNYKCTKEGQLLVRPLYFRYPQLQKAYEFKNEYFFGTELLVNPITSPVCKASAMGSVKTWLPEGIWFDFFSGLSYRGGRTVEMFRTLETIPVLAKAGGIVPMETEETVSAHTGNPESVELRVFGGADGAFTLYEDDGQTMAYEEGKSVRTQFTLDWENGSFVIEPCEGDASLIPENRTYRIVFYGVSEDTAAAVTAVCGEQPVIVDKRYDKVRNVLTVGLPRLPADEKIEVLLGNTPALAPNRVVPKCYEILNRAQMKYDVKNELYHVIERECHTECLISEIESADMADDMKKALLEIVTARLE